MNKLKFDHPKSIINGNALKLIQSIRLRTKECELNIMHEIENAFRLWPSFEPSRTLFKRIVENEVSQNNFLSFVQNLNDSVHIYSLFRQMMFKFIPFPKHNFNMKQKKEERCSGRWSSHYAWSFHGTNGNLTNHLLWSSNCKKMRIHDSVLVRQTCNLFKSWYEIGVTIVI